MAGSGPAPKFNRQRSKAPTRGDWIRLSPLEAPVLPDLDEFEAPKDYEQELAPDGTPQARVWPTRTRFMWDSWRTAHVTGLWSSDDIALAVDTIYLHATGAQGKAAEIRLRMESLGLTPKGRADRRYLLPDEQEPPSELPEGVTPIRPQERDIPQAI